MGHLLSLPFRALAGFFEISVMGALGYIVGVIGFVLIPGAYKLMQLTKAPKPVALAVAVVLGTYAGGAALGIAFGGMGGMDGALDVSTHDLAIAQLNACPAATAALESPIRRTGVGRGTYETRGAFGTSSWILDVAGPHRHGKAAYAAEMHGGTWALTALALKIDDREIDLGSCLHDARIAAPASGPVHVTTTDVVGLWGTPRDRTLVLTRFDADGHFASGVFVDDKLTMRVRGTWELDGATLTWHYDRAHSDAPAAFWAELGDARVAADPNPIVEMSKARMVIQEVDGSLTEMRPMDPGRLADLVRQLDP